MQSTRVLLEKNDYFQVFEFDFCSILYVSYTVNVLVTDKS